MITSSYLYRSSKFFRSQTVSAVVGTCGLGSVDEEFHGPQQSGAGEASNLVDKKWVTAVNV